MKRLPALFSLIECCEVLADVGCDHGMISQYVLQNKLARKVIATDISHKCLQKAKNLLSDYDNIEFVCTDGLKGIEADTVIIAGLGGATIIDILKAKLEHNQESELKRKRELGQECEQRLGQECEQESEQESERESGQEQGNAGKCTLGIDVLILQPQDHCAQLRQFLSQIGYKISWDLVAKENEKFYDILLAQPGAQTLDECQLKLGVYYNYPIIDEYNTSHNKQLEYAAELGYHDKLSESSALLRERLIKEYNKFCSFNDNGKNAEKRAFLKQSLMRLGYYEPSFIKHIKEEKSDKDF